MMCDARLFWPQIVALGHDRAVMVAPLTGASSIAAPAASVPAPAPANFALAALAMGGLAAMAVLARGPDRGTRLAAREINCPAENPPVGAAHPPQALR